MDRDDAGSLTLPSALFALGIASLLFDLGSVLLKAPFLRAGVTVGDAIEAAGVYGVLALFWRVRRLAGGRAFLAGLAAVTFAFGHGVHLAANSIHDLAGRSGLGDPTGLLDFWDERAGHYLVESGRALFAASLLAVPASAPAVRSRGAALRTAIGGASYGFITFASAVEGQTVPFLLPFYALLGGYGAASALRIVPPVGGLWVRRFFVIAAFTALLFFAIWGIWQHGFPEFTSAGIIRGAGGPPE
jgi:hypothetical protein